jgi:hypothetical protein
MYTINTTSYNKAIRIPYNEKISCGYQPRPIGRLDIRSLLIHTTNGVYGSSLRAEADYIANSRVISSHFLIGKNGEIIQFLDPRYYIAYHAGCVKAMLYSNLFAVGIELHNTPAEGHITFLQKQALDWLARDIVHGYGIKKEAIETHRNVAVYCKGHRLAGQLGRKIDPSGFPDNEFYAWRDSLYIPILGNTYRVTSIRGVNVRQSPQVNEHNIAGVLQYNDVFIGGEIKKDENNQFINGSNEWVHILQGTSQGKPVDRLGFVHLSNLRRV